MKDIEGNDINLSFSAPEAVYSILGRYVTAQGKAHQRVYVFLCNNSEYGKQTAKSVTVM